MFTVTFELKAINSNAPGEYYRPIRTAGTHWNGLRRSWGARGAVTSKNRWFCSMWPRLTRKSPQGSWHSALSRCPKKVGQAARVDLVGIIWVFFSRYWHIERRREPSQQLVEPTEFSRTCVACRPEGARQNQGKRAPTKFSDEGRGMGSHLRKRVKTVRDLIDTHRKKRRYTEDTQLKKHMSPSSAPDLRIALRHGRSPRGPTPTYRVRTLGCPGNRKR